MLSVDVFKEKSVHGYPLDILVSALQKSIRRADRELAVQVAVELMYTSRELEDYVWKRLLVISAEDIGKANWGANAIVKSLYDSSLLLDDAQAVGDRRILMIHAISFLCASGKDRSSCLLSDIAKREFLAAKPIDFPDYVYDMHTARGQELGHGFDHFLNVASKVVPDTNEEEEEALKARLAALLDPKEL